MMCAIPCCGAAPLSRELGGPGAALKCSLSFDPQLYRFVGKSVEDKETAVTVAWAARSRSHGPGRRIRAAGDQGRFQSESELESSTRT